MTEVNEISSVAIRRRKINPDGVCLDEMYVRVKDTDIGKCRKMAREILKEDLK